MSGSAVADAIKGSSAESTPLQLPVMGNPMQYINPVYTQRSADTSMSPLAAFYEFRRTGKMPQQSQFQQFTAPTMPTMAVNTFYNRPVAALSPMDGYGGGSGGDSGPSGGGASAGDGSGDGSGNGGTTGSDTGADGVGDGGVGGVGDAGDGSGDGGDGGGGGGGGGGK